MINNKINNNFFFSITNLINHQKLHQFFVHTKISEKSYSNLFILFFMCTFIQQLLSLQLYLAVIYYPVEYFIASFLFLFILLLKSFCLLFIHLQFHLAVIFYLVAIIFYLFIISCVSYFLPNLTLFIYSFFSIFLLFSSFYLLIFHSFI